MIHGTLTAYTNGACRCDDCKRANMINKKRWRIRTKADGDRARIPDLVDVMPVRVHVARLLASGWTKSQIAREIGRTPQGFYNLIDRQRSANGKKIRRDIAAAIYALEPLTPEPDDYVDPVVIDRLFDGSMSWRDATQAEREEAGRIALARGDGGWKFCAEVLHLGPSVMRRIRREVAA